MNVVLTALLAALIIGYAVYLAYRFIRKPEKLCGGCSGCPMAGKCDKQKS